MEQLLNFMYRHVADILQDAEVSVATDIKESNGVLNGNAVRMPA